MACFELVGNERTGGRNDSVEQLSDKPCLTMPAAHETRRISIRLFQLSDTRSFRHQNPTFQAANQQSTLFRYSCRGMLAGCNTLSRSFGKQDNNNENTRVEHYE
jgi:hypothetical protein